MPAKVAVLGVAAMPAAVFAALGAPRGASYKMIPGPVGLAGRFALGGGVRGAEGAGETFDIRGLGSCVDGVDAGAGSGWCGRSGGPECCLKACSRRAGTRGVRGVGGGAGAGAGAGAGVMTPMSESELWRSRTTGVCVGEVAAGGVCGGKRCGWMCGTARRVARRADSVACVFWRCLTSRARWWACSAVCSPRWRFRIASSSARSWAADRAAMLVGVEL